MSLKPETAVTIIHDGRQFVLSAELKGERVCIGLDKDRRTVGVDPADRAALFRQAKNMFLALRQPVPRIHFAGHSRAGIHLLRGVVLNAENEPARPRSTYSVREQRMPGTTLDWFAGWFRGETREQIRAAAGDLRKEVRDLLAGGASRWRIRRECCWTTAATLVPIVFDRVARIVRAVMSVMREFDGPRPG